MKNLFHWVFVAALLATSALASNSYAQNATTQSARIGVVNTKKCLENSKIGKQEQANFEKMKTQMESVLQTKERELEEIETKLNDDDYMDSISDEVAAELRNKKRNLRKDGMALQNQYMQTLQQANYKIIQKITEVITKASQQVAQEPSSGLDLILTDDATTYFVPALDVTDRIVAKMNAIYDQEQAKK
jgi:outer membrane protein